MKIPNDVNNVVPSLVVSDLDEISFKCSKVN